MSIRLKIFVVFGALLAACGAFAQESSTQGAGVVNAKTRSVQAKAEELYDRGEYKRAHFIYQKELAPIGDKYAQYMLGWMYAEGQWVDEDLVIASAWYRLAAERGSPEFVIVRDEVLGQLDDEDLARSDEAYLNLCSQYADIVLRMRHVREYYESVTEGTTGSRITVSSAPVTIVTGAGGPGMSGDAYYAGVLRGMQKHLDHITRVLEIEPIDAEHLSLSKLSRLEREVMAYVAVVNDR